jgi:hypothetical protein
VLKNRAQQVVAVIGLGLLLWYLGEYVTSLGIPPAVFGWVAYAPLAHTYSAPGADLTSAEQMLVWLGLIALWACGSLLILRDRAGANSSDPD